MKKLFLGTMLCCFLLYSEAFAAVSMPSFTLPKAVDGTQVTSETFKGRALLITFFATWCGTCMSEIPVLKKLQQKYHDQGFDIVALSLDQGGAKIVASLVKKAGISYPVLMADEEIVKKFDDIPYLPTSFLVNKKGHVVRKYAYPPSPSVLERDIQSVL